ncbi:LysR family transcriptional regulator BsrA [Zestomonas carbonaria]|uniref:HTH-type transcriptional regulator LeuO n=1 Tax=Zestomonas carbonaria TaxID=2762745 RepID=A0A7U7ESE9_9GAMM|nr:LysR substrate-binding domain-containing protein [Pseudomonas carbonaria]CAD5110324.1 HTH-type transcriptional regulator LeuO [Pseudomonas carbonaria]
MAVNLRSMDLNLLLVFDALMQEQNLSRAALRLHMSQPAVSNALARLRAQLNEPLFIRTARGMSPTPQAQALYGPVRQALHLLRIGLGAQEAFDPQEEHLFRLSLNDYAQATLLPSLLARLELSAPRVVLSVQGDDADSLTTRLATGELDLAIDYLYFDNDDLRYQPLLVEQLVVIGRAGHPAFTNGLTLAGYQQSHHVSILPRAGRGSPLEIVLGSAKVRRQVQLHVPHYLTIPPIVAQSSLLGTVPRRLADHFAPIYALQVAPLPVDMPDVQISLIWHRQQELSPGLRWLRERIVQTCAALSAV